MRLSAIIVNWNTSSLLEACIRSIEKFPPDCEHEVVVVDNASSDFDEAEFRGSFPNTVLIANSENTGYARGNNQGIERASGDYILLLNPDTQVTDGALRHLIEFMESHLEAAAAGPRLVRPDGSIDRSVRGFPYPGPIAWELLGLAKLFPRSRRFGAYRMSYFTYDEAVEVDQPMGSCLILRKSAIDDIGMLDEQFPIFFNEVDWLYRAKQKGWKVYFTPDAVVIHHGGAGTRQAGRRKMRRESHDSLLKFYEKHFRGDMSAPAYWLSNVCIRISRMLNG